MPGQPDLRQVEDQGKSPDQHQKRADDRAPVAVTQHIDELQQDAGHRGEQRAGQELPVVISTYRQSYRTLHIVS